MLPHTVIPSDDHLNPLHTPLFFWLLNPTLPYQSYLCATTTTTAEIRFTPLALHLRFPVYPGSHKFCYAYPTLPHVHPSFLTLEAGQSRTLLSTFVLYILLLLAPLVTYFWVLLVVVYFFTVSFITISNQHSKKDQRSSPSISYLVHIFYHH